MKKSMDFFSGNTVDMKERYFSSATYSFNGEEYKFTPQSFCLLDPSKKSYVDTILYICLNAKSRVPSAIGNILLNYAFENHWEVEMLSEEMIEHVFEFSQGIVAELIEEMPFTRKLAKNKRIMVLEEIIPTNKSVK